MTDVHAFVTRVNPEPENDKPGLMDAIDELVTGPLDSFHIERMTDGQYWMALYKGDQRQVIVITAKGSTIAPPTPSMVMRCARTSMI